MAIRINKEMQINGVDYPAGVAIIGLDQMAEALAMQGGGAVQVNLAVVDTAGTAVSVVNDLTTGGATAALSAQQGVAIKAITDGLTTGMAAKVATTSVGSANGVAALDATGKVPTAQLPVTGASLGTRMLKPSRTAVHMFPSAAVNSVTFKASDFGYAAGTAPFVNFQQVFDVEADFDEIALIYINGSLTAPIPISKATVNVGPSAADKQMNGTAYTPVTFSGAAGITVPVATTVTGLGTFPSYVVSDFVPLSSVPRTDVVGGRPLVYTRTQVSPTIATDPISALQRSGTDWAGFPNTYGRYFAGGYNAGATDATSGTWPGGAPGSTTLSGPCIGAVYRARNGRVLTVFAFGDSTYLGAGTTSGTQWVQKAGWIASGGTTTVPAAATPIETCFWGFAGQTPATYKKAFDTMLAQIASLPFNALLWEAYSPNGAGTPPVSRQYTSEVLSKCDINGIYPIVTNGIPASTITTQPNDALRLAYNIELLNKDCVVVDIDAIVTDGGTGARAPIASIQASLSTDNLHLNNAGDSNQATAVATKLSAIASAYFGSKTN